MRRIRSTPDNPLAAARKGRRLQPSTMETTMNRILEVTEDDTLILEFVDLDDLRNEGILPQNPSQLADQ